MTDEGSDSLSATLSRMTYRRNHFFYSVNPPTAARNIQDKDRKARIFVHFKVTKISYQKTFLTTKTCIDQVVIIMLHLTYV